MPIDKALASADTPAFLTGRPSSPPDVDRVQAGSHIGLVLVPRSDLRSDPDYGLRQYLPLAKATGEESGSTAADDSTRGAAFIMGPPQHARGTPIVHRHWCSSVTAVLLLYTVGVPILCTLYAH